MRRWLANYNLLLVLVGLFQLPFPVVSNFKWPVTEEKPLPPVETPTSLCPKQFKPNVVIVAGTRHDSAWLRRLGDHIDHIVYQQEDPARPHYYLKAGNEVGAYLQFILDYYDCLPDVTAFVHGHEEEGWHNHDMYRTLAGLQWHKIPGYTDLNRKMGIWELQLKDRPKYPDNVIASGEEVYNGNYDPRTIMGGNAYDPEETFHFLQREANVHAFDRFFGRAGLGAMPYKVSFVCCSQFAVTRDRIRLRSKDFWALNKHYMLHNDLQASNARPKHHVVGDVWTVFWPLIFGESAEYQRATSDEELFGSM